MHIMKKFLLLMLMAIGIITPNKAQDITQNDFPAAGTQIIYTRDNNPQMPWSSLSGYSAWDISWASATDSVFVTAMLPSNTSWASLFPESNYVLKYKTPTDTAYYYYNLTDTAIIQVGLVVYSEGQAVGFKYDQQMTLMHFPFSQGDTVWSPKTATTSLYGVTLNLTHNDSVIYLYSGTLTLPNGSQYSVGLIKHYSYIHIYSPNMVDETYEDYVYEWYDLNNHYILASADSSVTLQKFASVQYLDTIRNTSAAVAQILSNIKIGPNPAHNTLTLQSQPGNYNVKVFNLQGKAIANRNFFHQTTINLAGLENGVYILMISGKQGTLTLKFIKN